MTSVKLMGLLRLSRAVSVVAMHFIPAGGRCPERVLWTGCQCHLALCGGGASEPRALLPLLVSGACTGSLLHLHSRDLRALFFSREPAVPAPAAGGLLVSALMLVLLLARGSVLSGCAGLHRDPNWRMLLIFWGYRVLLQRVPGEGGVPDFPPGDQTHPAVS